MPLPHIIFVEHHHDAAVGRFLKEAGPHLKALGYDHFYNEAPFGTTIDDLLINQEGAAQQINQFLMMWTKFGLDADSTPQLSDYLKEYNSLMSHCEFIRSLNSLEITYRAIDAEEVIDPSKREYFLSDEGMSSRDKLMSTAYLEENTPVFGVVGYRHMLGIQSQILKNLSVNEAAEKFLFIYLFSENFVEDYEKKLRANEIGHPLSFQCFDISVLPIESHVDKLIKLINQQMNQNLATDNDRLVSTQQNNDHVNKFILPNDLLSHILLFCSSDDLLKISFVCKNWHHHCETVFENRNNHLVKGEISIKDYSSNKIAFFTHHKFIQNQLSNLVKDLTCNRTLVAYETYLEQHEIFNELVGKNAKFAKQIIMELSKSASVNSTNNYNVNILHNLIWFNQAELAQLVIKSKFFTKINAQYAIPSLGMEQVATALDLAITVWLHKENDSITLDFIKVLLSYRAKIPNLDRRFLTSTFSETLVLFILNDTIPSKRSSTETHELLLLLNTYGLSLKTLKENIIYKLGVDSLLASQIEAYLGLSKQEQIKKLDIVFETLVNTTSIDLIDAVYCSEVLDDNYEEDNNTTEIGGCLIM